MSPVYLRIDDDGVAHLVDELFTIETRRRTREQIEADLADYVTMGYDGCRVVEVKGEERPWVLLRPLG